MEYSIITIATAVIGAIVGLLFHRIEKKIDKIEKDNEKHHREQVQIRIAERELMIAEAHISELVVRKMRKEDVNGELALADEALKAKKEVVDKITRQIAIEYMEGN